LASIPPAASDALEAEFKTDQIGNACHSLNQDGTILRLKRPDRALKTLSARQSLSSLRKVHPTADSKRKWGNDQTEKWFLKTHT
jgi:hypothetical protein